MLSLKRVSVFLLAITFALPASSSFASDLTITAANVATAEQGAVVRNVRAGETITAGMPVYRNTSDNEYYKCDADASATAASCAGIALSAGSDGTYITIITSGRYKVGSTVTVGTQYFVSDTAGGIMPGADFDTGDYITPIGTTVGTDTILVDINITGDQK